MANPLVIACTVVRRFCNLVLVFAPLRSAYNTCRRHTMASTYCARPHSYGVYSRLFFATAWLIADIGASPSSKHLKTEAALAARHTCDSCRSPATAMQAHGWVHALATERWMRWRPPPPPLRTCPRAFGRASSATLSWCTYAHETHALCTTPIGSHVCAFFAC